MLGRMFFQFFFLKRIKKKKFYLMREDFPLPVGPKRITFNESGINSRFFSDFSILNSERVSLKSTIFLLRTCKILFSLWGDPPPPVAIVKRPVMSYWSPLPERVSPLLRRFIVAGLL